MAESRRHLAAAAVMRTLATVAALTFLCANTWPDLQYCQLEQNIGAIFTKNVIRRKSYANNSSPQFAIFAKYFKCFALRIAKKRLRMVASDSLYSFQCAVCHSARCGTGHSLSLVSRRRSCRVPGRGHVPRNLTPAFRDTFLLVILRLVSSLLVMGH